MSKRYYTVVYEITDEEAFKRVSSAAIGSMETDTGLIPGVKVVACGNGDTMTAYDALAQHLTNNGHNVDDVVMEFCEEMELDGPAIIG